MVAEKLARADVATHQLAQSISVIVPTLNEVGNVDGLLGAILAQATSSLEIEVLIADGGSIDGTIDRVREWETTSPIRLIVGGKQGLAGDVLAAARQATSEVVVVIDADFSHPPASIPELVAPIFDGTSDLVIGSRYVPGGSTPDWPWRRKLLSQSRGGLGLAPC